MPVRMCCTTTAASIASGRGQCPPPSFRCVFVKGGRRASAGLTCAPRCSLSVLQDDCSKAIQSAHDRMVVGTGAHDNVLAQLVQVLADAGEDEREGEGSGYAALRMLSMVLCC